MSNSLLPSNASKLERVIEKVIEHCTKFPIDVRDLWDPWRCPLELLPWLAWAYSVDNWNEHWPEHIKRNVVDSSYQVHRYKGTPFAVQHALDALGIKTDIIEWWEPDGSGTPGTFAINTMISDQGIDLTLISAIYAQIGIAKRGSQHFTLRTVLSNNAEQYLACGTCAASIATVEPYAVRELESQGDMYMSLGTISAAITTIEAYQ
ncbi:phage tail protein I [Shewanella sp.]|uniref:phage tail protein I n=1 Tax=Shewanella sp. TaxID=50422 RepID=UPI003564940C